MSSDDYRAVINRNLIKSAVDASPHKIAIIAVSNGAGASQIDDLLGHRFATDHVAVAWFDERTQTYQLAEMTPGGEYTPGSIGQSKFSDPGTSNSQDFMYRVASSMLGSKNDPGTINSLSMGSQDVTAIPLMNFTAEQASGFLSSVQQYTAAGQPYSLLSNGDTCVSAIYKAALEWGLLDDLTPWGDGWVNSILPSTVVEAFASQAPAWHSTGHIIGTYDGGMEGGHAIFGYYDTDFQASIVTQDNVSATWDYDLVI